MPGRAPPHGPSSHAAQQRSTTTQPGTQVPPSTKQSKRHANPINPIRCLLDFLLSPTPNRVSTRTHAGVPHATITPLAPAAAVSCRLCSLPCLSLVRFFLLKSRPQTDFFSKSREANTGNHLRKRRPISNLSPTLCRSIVGRRPLSYHTLSIHASVPATHPAPPPFA